jgi:flagellar hook assembly protein FlgD
VPELSPVVEARVDIHPNPFNPTTMVTFVLPESGQTSFEIFDVRGRLVRTLVEGSYGVGPHRVPWDGRDNQGESLASGVYFGKLTLPGGGEKVRKMALIR